MMVSRPRVLGFLLLFLAVAVGVAAAPRAGGARPGGVLAPLQKGQDVSLKEVSGGYQISLVPGVQLSHKVTEVGADYVVLVDVAGVTERRIPIYAVRAVVINRLAPR